MDLGAIVAVVCGLVSIVAGVLLNREHRIRRQAEARAVLDERRLQLREKLDRRRAATEATRDKRLAESEAKHLESVRHLSTEAAKLLAVEDLEALAKLWNSSRGGDE